MTIRCVRLVLVLMAVSAVSVAAQTVTVDGLPSSPAVLYTPPNAAVQVEVLAAGSPLDWATLVPVSAAPGYYETWMYLNGSQTPPPVAVSVSAFTVIPPVDGGPYEVRVFANNGYTRLATSSPIVMGPSVLLPVLVCTSAACVQPSKGATVELHDHTTPAVLKRHVVGEDGTTGFYVSPGSFPSPYVVVQWYGVTATADVGSAGTLTTIVIARP